MRRPRVASCDPAERYLNALREANQKQRARWLVRVEDHDAAIVEYQGLVLEEVKDFVEWHVSRGRKRGMAESAAFRAVNAKATHVQAAVRRPLDDAAIDERFGNLLDSIRETKVEAEVLEARADWDDAFHVRLQHLEVDTSNIGECASTFVVLEEARRNARDKPAQKLRYRIEALERFAEMPRVSALRHCELYPMPAEWSHLVETRKRWGYRAPWQLPPFPPRRLGGLR